VGFFKGFVMWVCRAFEQTNKEMVMKTMADIDAEIAALEHASRNLRVTHSAFGDDHRESIAAQINVLTRRMDHDDVEAAYGEQALGGEFVETVYDDALAACDWMQGYLGEDAQAPSGPDGWGCLLRRDAKEDEDAAA
jgi:hypothetical protein